MKQALKTIGISGAAVSAYLVSSSAMAASVADAAVAQLGGDAIDTVTAIGVALLGVAVVAMIFKWAKAMFFS